MAARTGPRDPAPYGRGARYLARRPARLRLARGPAPVQEGRPLLSAHRRRRHRRGPCRIGGTQRRALRPLGGKTIEPHPYPSASGKRRAHRQRRPRGPGGRRHGGLVDDAARFSPLRRGLHRPRQGNLPRAGCLGRRLARPESGFGQGGDVVSGAPAAAGFPARRKRLRALRRSFPRSALDLPPYAAERILQPLRAAGLPAPQAAPGHAPGKRRREFRRPAPASW